MKPAVRARGRKDCPSCEVRELVTEPLCLLWAAVRQHAFVTWVSDCKTHLANRDLASEPL